MRADHKNLSDGELRELLNLGDPAADGVESAPEEVAAMRRTVLNAIDTSPTARPWLSRPWLSRPYLTATATIAVALIALALLLQAGPWSAVLQPEIGPATPPEPATAAPIDSAAGVAESPLAELPVAPAEQPPVAAVEESRGIVPPTVEREPRTVRFTAPGGTRIIWTLDPDFQFPVGEPDDRARGEL